MKKIVAFIVVALMLVSSVAFAAEAPMTDAESSTVITEATAEAPGENVDVEPSDSAELSIEQGAGPSMEPIAGPTQNVEQHEALETVPGGEIEEQVDGPNEDVQDGFQPAENFAHVDAEVLQAIYDQTKADEQSMVAQDYHLIVNRPPSGGVYYTGADIYTEAEMYDCYGWYYGIIVYKNGSLYDIVTGNNFIEVSGTQTYYGNWDTSDYTTGDYEMVAVVTTGLDFSGTLMYTAHRYITLLEPTAIKSFVTRMYQTVLDRNPDSDGLAFWTKNLVKGKNTGADLAYSFFFSTEMKKKNLSDSAFIEALYKAVFGRTSDPGGKAYWQGLLDKGCSRKVVFAGLINSKEYRTLCLNYGINAGSYTSNEARDKNANITAFVNRMYTLCLGRKGDADGLNFWTSGLLNKSLTGASAAANFLNSKEFAGKNLSNSAYLDVVYQAMFGRKSDAAGKSYWISQMNQGVSRRNILATFVNSTEYSKICASYGIVRGSM